MRTKTSLLAAAALSLGLLSASAEVYSQNIVGYINVSSGPGFQMIANQLDNGTGNTVGQLMPTMPLGSLLYKFGVGGFIGNNYTGVWGDTNMTLNPGEGAFLFLPTGQFMTNTFVGNVMTGNLTNALPQGFAIVSSMVPQGGDVTVDLGYPPVLGNIIYKYIAGYQGFNFTGTWSPSNPVVKVGESFFSFKPTGTATNWVRVFNP